MRTVWRRCFAWRPRLVRVIVDESAPALEAWTGSGSLLVWLRWIEYRIGDDGRAEYAIRGRQETEAEWYDRQI